MSTFKRFMPAVVCAVALVAGACGDDGDDDVAEVTTTAATTSTEEDTTTTGEVTTTEADEAPETEEAQADSDGGADTAEAAVRTAIEARSLGQTGRAWELTLPAQRAQLSREAFFSCMDGSPLDVLNLEVVDQYNERGPVAGVGEQEAVAFTVRVTVSMGGEEFTETDTFRAYSESGRWYVALNDERFACSQL